MQVAIEVVAVIVFVDFASGLFHWLEDSYGKPEWPVTGKWITVPNIIHHHDPTFFTQHSWFKSAEVLLTLGTLTILSAWYLNILTWHVLLFVAIGINANEIHKWNHLPRSRRKKIVLFLQRVYLLQTPTHHAMHHMNSKDTYYCVITNVVNPVFETINFWRKLENILFKVFGLQKRKDSSLSSNSLGHDMKALLDQTA